MLGASLQRCDRFDPSGMSPETMPFASHGPKHCPGSKKRKKTKTLRIDIDEIIPTQESPPDAKFEGYRDFVVPDFVMESRNTRCLGAVYQLPVASQHASNQAHTSLQRTSLQRYVGSTPRHRFALTLATTCLPVSSQRIPNRDSISFDCCANTKVGVYSLKWQRDNLRLPQSSSSSRNDRTQLFFVLH